MLRHLVTLSALSLGCATLANANIIGPGQTNTPDALNPNGFNLVQTSGVITATNLATQKTQYTVNYTVGVYEDFSSQVCSGCLDFYYIFTNNGPGGNERFTGGDFTGFITDVGYNATHSGQDPISVDRSSDGSAIGFNFTGPDTLAAGSSTNILVIETDATSYTAGTFTVNDGVSVTGLAYAPSMASTPEPASFALLGTGLLGVVSAARRKFNA